MTVTNTFASGDLILAAAMNTNFADALSATRGLTTQNLATSAGILSSQLADRFGMLPFNRSLLPFSSGATLASPALYTTQTTTADPGTEIGRIKVYLPSGRAAYLAAVLFRAAEVAVATTAYPKCWVTINGVTKGGGGVAINANATDFALVNANPFQNPIGSIANGDYISFGLGRSDTSGTPSIRGLEVTCWFKVELGS